MSSPVDGYGIQTLQRLLRAEKAKDAKLKASEAGFADRKKGIKTPATKPVTSNTPKTVVTESKPEKSIPKPVELTMPKPKVQVAPVVTTPVEEPKVAEVVVEQQSMKEIPKNEVATTQVVVAEDPGPIVVNDKLSKEQVQGFLESFELFDSDKDGRITVDEVRAILDALGQGVSQDVLDLIDEFDANKNGTIEFNEYLEIMVKMKEMYASDDFVGMPVGIVMNEQVEETTRGKKLGDIVSGDDINQEFRDLAGDGNITGMKQLLARGADINSVSTKTGYTALHRACAENDVDAVAFLLKQPGILVNEASKFGLTPASLATTKADEIGELIEKAVGDDAVKKAILLTSGGGDLPSPIGTYHVYIAHSYPEHSKAAAIQAQLEKLGVKVCCPNTLIVNEQTVENDVSKSDLVIVLVTKKYLRDLENERAGAFKEHEVVQLLKADVMREIIYINGNKNLSEDQKATLPGCLESKNFDMTNDKEVAESIGLLLSEIKHRLLM